MIRPTLALLLIATVSLPACGTPKAVEAPEWRDDVDAELEVLKAEIQAASSKVDELQAEATAIRARMNDLIAQGNDADKTELASLKDEAKAGVIKAEKQLANLATLEAQHAALKAERAKRLTEEAGG